MKGYLIHGGAASGGMANMVKLVLVRHGETPWNILGRFQGQSDIGLSEKGLQQADALANNFPVDHLDAIYSSDLKRAKVTAQKIALKFGLPLELDPSFREIDFGDWESHTYDEIVEKNPNALDNFFLHPDILDIPHGETFQQVQDRAIQALQEIVAVNDGKTIAIVAHGAVIRAMICWFLDIPLRNVWKLRQYNTAVNIFACEDGFWTTEQINGTAHLL